MADRPILFSAPMVRALLDNRKTQTRRIIKPQPGPCDHKPWPGVYEPRWKIDGTEMYCATCGNGVALTRDGKGTRAIPLRFAKGDRLWVRETWRDEHPIAIQEGRYSQEGRAGIPGPPGVSYRTIYRADGEPLQAWRRADGEHPYFTLAGPADDVAARHPAVCSTFDRTDGQGAAWSPPIHMPRWASRLTLTVTDVRVQQLQNIDEIDAMAGGIIRSNPTEEDAAEFMAMEGGDIYSSAVDAYEALWNRINGAMAWAANPWIVALTFTVERRNIDAPRAA